MEFLDDDNQDDDDLDFETLLQRGYNVYIPYGPVKKASVQNEIKKEMNT